MKDRFRRPEDEPDTGPAPFRALGAERNQEAFDFRPANVRGTGLAKIASKMRRCLAFILYDTRKRWHAPNAAADKIMRLHAQSAVIENGFVWLPEEAPWLADYLAELTAFPAGRHDDQVDSTS
jgi:hypothetical protein